MYDIIDLIVAGVAAFIAGFGAGISVKVIYDRSNKYNVLQKGNTAGGDIAGRDITKG